MVAIDANIQTLFTRPLVQWYRGAGRNLPWRKTKDPYAIWVSEIMLQQTQVATVLPYYQRFLTAFPSIQALALEDLEKVLMLWQGLGYYARARHLHQAAREVMKRFGGKLPSAFEQLSALPGIGRSTAGAILTIAFGERYPILDGNVRRVLCRFFAIEKEARDKAVEKWLWRCSENLLPKREVDLYLQAVMDLGATCCTPKKPLCCSCPLKEACGAFRSGLQDILPIKRVAKKIPHFDHFAGVVLCGDAVLIRRRPLEGLLAGLWEFPGERTNPDSKECSISSNYEDFFSREVNLDVSHARPWMTIRHVFTHFKMTLHVFSCSLKKCVNRDAPFRWVSHRDLNDYPFSAAHQKIALRLLDLDGQEDLV